MSPDLYWVAVAATTILATSRLMRLWTYDDFPPVRWANDKFMNFADKHAPSWAELGFCPWCCGFWIALIVAGSGWACDVYGPGDTPVGNDWPAFMIWWFVMGSLAVSYLAAMIMVRDDPADNKDEKSKPETDL